MVVSHLKVHLTEANYTWILDCSQRSQFAVTVGGLNWPKNETLFYFFFFFLELKLEAPSICTENSIGVVGKQYFFSFLVFAKLCR